MTWGWGKRPRIKNYQRVEGHEGRSFASKLEAAVYDHLRLLEVCGDISDITQQPTIYLTEARIGMRPDFSAYDKRLEQWIYVEAKGFAGDVWLLKKKLYGVYGDRPLHIYTGTHKAPRLSEVITPKHFKKGVPGE